MSSNHTKKLFKDLHNANYLNNGFVQLQGTSDYKKKFTFCPGQSRENLPNIFQDFPGLMNKIQGLSRTFQNRKKIQDFSSMWQPWLLFAKRPHPIALAVHIVCFAHCLPDKKWLLATGESGHLLHRQATSMTFSNPA